MRTRWRLAFLSLVLAASSPSFADELNELRELRDTTIGLVNALVEQGVLTRAKADAIIAQAQRSGAKPAAGGAANTPANGAALAGASSPTPAAVPNSATPAAVPPAAPGVVRVPYVPEAVKEEIRDQVKSDVLAQAKAERWGDPGAFPEWLRHFTWYGDIRLREQLDRFPTDNTPNATVAELQAFGVNIANSTEANNRSRVRARFGFDATVGDTVTAGVRLSTGGVGAGSNPGSENQTLGNYETRSSVGFDRAYIAYHPESWLTLTGGRVGMPFFKPTTLIWADDVSLEGLVARFDPKVSRNWTLFTTAGAFPILQNDPTPLSSAKSKWLYAYQSGFQVTFNENPRQRRGIEWRHVLRRVGLVAHPGALARRSAVVVVGTFRRRFLDPSLQPKINDVVVRPIGRTRGKWHIRCMRCCFHPGYQVPLPPGHPFPISKFPLLRERLLTEKIIEPADLYQPEPADVSALELVHTREYLRKLETSSLTASELRRLGMPWSEALWLRSRLAVGGTLLAARMALEDGLAANLAGGTHHAFADHGEGFCVLNDVAIATCQLRGEGAISRAVVIDLDVHQGNGTAAIFEDDPQVFTFSMHGERNYPSIKMRSTLDVALADGTGDADYLSSLSEYLPSALDRAHPDIAFYLAGVDVAAGDRFGKLALSDAGIRERDHRVIGSVRDRGIPLVIVLGGGYAPTRTRTTELHMHAFREAVAYERLRAVRLSQGVNPAGPGATAS